MNRRNDLIIGVLMLIVGITLVAVPVVQFLANTKDVAAVSFFDRIGLTGGYEQELLKGDYITVIDEKSGAIVDKIARVVYNGDEIITGSNNHYRVTKVKGSKAFAKNIGKAKDIVWKDEWDIAPAGVNVQTAQTGLNKTQIAIYHTHTGESYVPTEGTENIPARGGILKVGTTLADALKNKGISVVDDKTPHEPHDANAYHRSRKTAVKLLKQRPVAILDVHRDGVPDPEFYKQQLNGREITKVRLVVGRQNPHMASNLQFAKDIKAYMDKTKPGLIQGIFMGRGNYNQDLGPRAILLEIGTHTNSRERAENGAAVFAEAFPAVLNLRPAAAGDTPAPGAPNIGAPGEGRTAWSTVGWIIGIILVAGAAFLFISTGSIKGMKSKLGELRKTEFANFFGLKKNKRKDDDDKQS